jgi:hypothetical protein
LGIEPTVYLTGEKPDEHECPPGHYDANNQQRFPWVLIRAITVTDCVVVVDRRPPVGVSIDAIIITDGRI